MSPSHDLTIRTLDLDHVTLILEPSAPLGHTDDIEDIRERECSCLPHHDLTIQEEEKDTNDGDKIKNHISYDRLPEKFVGS